MGRRGYIIEGPPFADQREEEGNVQNQRPSLWTKDTTIQGQLLGPPVSGRQYIRAHSIPCSGFEPIKPTPPNNLNKSVRGAHRKTCISFSCFIPTSISLPHNNVKPTLNTNSEPFSDDLNSQPVRKVKLATPIL